MASQKGKSTGTRKSSLEFLQDFSAGNQSVLDIALDKIQPDPNQPRQTWHSADGLVPEEEEISLQNLAEDIKIQGVLQPIILREIGADKYMIVMGERRWRASKLAGLNTIPCIIRQDLGGVKVALAQLSENVQREEMSDLDTALFVQKTLEQYPELQKRDLAKLLNKSPSYISRMMGFIDQRWDHVVSTGIITYASVLEQFKSLPESIQNDLIKKSEERGSPIVAHEVQEAKRHAKIVKASSEDFSKLPVNPVSVIQEIDQASKVVSHQGSEVETYSRTPGPGVIIDKGDSDALTGLPNSAKEVVSKVVPANESQYVKMSLGQLHKLLDKVGIDASIPVTLPMTSTLMRDAIILFGGYLPEDESSLSQSLLDVIK